MIKLPYRPEIDGLRAVAVLVILLFHLDIGGLEGGFVGVDVFFVISGYLITRIVREDVEQERFGFLRFYGRRIRRLLPALLATIAAALLAGGLMLTPGAFLRMCKSALFATFSLANIGFWQSSGYFDEASGLQPLLHTWSLSVEEQFYLLWPALIWVLARRGGGRMLPGGIAAIGLASLAWGQWLLPHDPSMSFFFMPSRICEFTIGALLVWIPSSDGRSGTTREVVVAGGLGAITYAALTFDHQTAFPGLAALVPCLGTAAAIWGGNSALLGSGLGHRLPVWIGKISYSLYLVHWPLIVFYKQLKLEQLGAVDRVLLLGMSFTLAALLHQQVEQRFRHRQQRDGAGSPRAFALGTTFSALLLALVASQGHLSGGAPGRYPEAYAQLLMEGDRVTEADVDTWNLGSCYLGGSFGEEHRFRHFDKERCLRLDPDRPNVLLFGDSTAAHLIAGLQAIHGERINFLQATVASCRGRKATTRRGNCRDMHRYLLSKWLPKHRSEVAAVLFATRWDDAELVPWAKRLVTRFQKSGVPVVVIGPPVTFNTPVAAYIGARYSPAMVWAQFAMGNRSLPGLLMPPEALDPATGGVEALLRGVAQSGGADYISLLDRQCDELGCVVAARRPNGEPTFIQRDRLHFTPSGSAWAASTMSFEEITATESLHPDGR